MYRVGIVGHRYLRGPDTRAFVAEQCREILRSARETHPDVVAVSAFARGADSIFARTAVRMGIPLHSVRPFHSYVRDFPTTRSRREYLRLRCRACRELTLPFSHRTLESYVMAMHWIVSHTELLVAVWDGAPAIGPGGTADAVQQRMRVGTPWIHVDVRLADVGAAR
jgi:hypothetical protein